MKLNYKRTVLVGLAFFAICSFWQLYDHVVPLILKYSMGIKDGPSGIIMAADNLLGLFMLPFFGALSDRTSTRIGRRMPYILVGSVGAALTMLLLPVSAAHRNFWLFFLALAVVLFLMATYRSPAVALMPDVTIKPLRSKANAVINLMGALGGLIILLLITQMLPGKPELVNGVVEYQPNYMPIFLICAAIMLVATVVLFFTINEPKLAQQMQKQSRELGVEQEVDLQVSENRKRVPMPPAVRRSFLFLLASVVFWFMGYNAVTTSFSKYFVEKFAVAADGSASVLMIAQAAAIVSYIPVGAIATRVGRRKTIMAGVVMLAIAFAIGATVTEFGPILYGMFILAGIAWASINVNSYPMVVEMASAADTGQFTGYYYMASMSAQTITPILSGYMLDSKLFGYNWLFPYGAFFVALSFITMLFVRHGDAKPPAPKSRLEVFEAMDD